MDGTRVWADHPTVSLAEFEGMVRAVSNWGRWGPEDDRGTLNLLTPARVAAAARLVKSGRTVSMALDWNTVAGPDNPRPALHYVTQLGDRDPGEPQTNADFIGSDFHGKACSHMDALCHCDFRGKLYNGVPSGSSPGPRSTGLSSRRSRPRKACGWAPETSCSSAAAIADDETSLVRGTRTSSARACIRPRCPGCAIAMSRY